MISIVDIASYVPSDRESNFTKKKLFAIDDAFIKDKLGVHQVSRMKSGQETSDLCVGAFRNLAEKENIASDDVDFIVVCTQNPDGDGLPHTSSIVHAKIDGPDACACFDISLGCSGYVYGLSICQAFMEANGMTRGLFFTADPYSKIIDPQDKNTALLFGDAATVTLLENTDRAGVWVPKRFAFASRGGGGGCLQNVDGRLRMNGRAVFNFSALEVPVQITALLEADNHDLREIDMFFFHQGSKYIVDTLIRRLGLPIEKVPSNLSEQGNTVSSSIPLLFEQHMQAPNLKRVVLSGFGVGLSWASCIVEKRM